MADLSAITRDHPMRDHRASLYGMIATRAVSRIAGAALYLLRAIR
jgi:hypothetical protein